MDYNTYYNKILTDENMMETIQHGRSDYPFHFYYDNLSLFDFNCIEWHWHTELEFIYIESGTVTLWIGEDQFHLTEGNGIFINTKVLHRLYSPSKALIPNFVFMPSFIAPCDSLIYQKYILPIISYPLPFLIFHINPNGIPETEALSVNLFTIFPEVLSEGNHRESITFKVLNHLCCVHLSTAISRM